MKHVLTDFLTFADTFLRISIVLSCILCSDTSYFSVSFFFGCACACFGGGGVEVFTSPHLGRFEVHTTEEETLLDRALREVTTDNSRNHVRGKNDVFKKPHLLSGWGNN